MNASHQPPSTAAPFRFLEKSRAGKLQYEKAGDTRRLDYGI